MSSNHTYMTPKQTYLTLKTASEYGGGLIKRLSSAAIDASPTQRIRLLSAFPEIIEAYGPDTFLYLHSLSDQNHSTLPQTIRATTAPSATIR